VEGNVIRSAWPVPKKMLPSTGVGAEGILPALDRIGHPS
jgi:hypothetical protein